MMERLYTTVIFWKDNKLHQTIDRGVMTATQYNIYKNTLKEYSFGMGTDKIIFDEGNLLEEEWFCNTEES